MSTRRGFLRLIGAAPVAAPVALKEAAVSMGLSGPIGMGAAALGGIPANGGYPIGPDKGWLMKQLTELYSPQKQDEFHQQARHMARVLDADIAALRSISPARAYQMQIERAVAQLTANEKSWIERRLSELVA